MKNQPIRLPGLKPGVCSGLILSGAFLPRFKNRGLAPSNVSRGGEKGGYQSPRYALRTLALAKSSSPEPERAILPNSMTNPLWAMVRAC